MSIRACDVVIVNDGKVFPTRKKYVVAYVEGWVESDIIDGELKIRASYETEEEVAAHLKRLAGGP